MDILSAYFRSIHFLIIIFIFLNFVLLRAVANSKTADDEEPGSDNNDPDSKLPPVYATAPRVKVSEDVVTSELFFTCSYWKFCIFYLFFGNYTEKLCIMLHKDNILVSNLKK